MGNGIPVVLVILCLVIGLIVLVSAFSKPITALIQRHYPDTAFNIDNFILWVGIVVAGVAFGLTFIYLVLYP